MEGWDDGKMEEWKDGRMVEYWNGVRAAGGSSRRQWGETVKTIVRDSGKIARGKKAGSGSPGQTKQSGVRPAWE